MTHPHPSPGPTLGVNGWRLLGRRTGVGRYLLNVLRYWDDAAVAARFRRVVVYTPRPLGPERAELPPNLECRVLTPEARMLVWENAVFGPRVTDDVVLHPSFSRPLIARGRTVVVTHEASHKLYPQFFPRRHWYSMPSLYLGLYGWSARRADLVLSDNDSARSDVIRAYGVDPRRICAIPLAPTEAFQPGAPADAAAVRRKYCGADVPYFLHVGKLSPYRNVPALMEAFSRLKQRSDVPHALVVVGKNELGVGLQDMAAGLGIARHFVYLDYVSDAELVSLFQAATAFVMPYQYNTVSLPTLEAQACGIPVIATESLREMTGGHAILCGQPDAASLADALATVVRDDALRQKLSDEGRAFAQQFSWRRTSHATLDALARVAGGA
jgi:glycosyltransferase involved in cell wall biosynthesis